MRPRLSATDPRQTAFCGLVLLLVFACATPGAISSVSAQDFFEALESILEPFDPNSRNNEDPLAEEPEKPELRATEEVDQVAQLIGPRTSSIARRLLESHDALQTSPASERRQESIRILEEIIRAEPDQFIWTNRGRWTSVRRLARELLHQLQPADDRRPGISAYRSASLSAVAQASLRSRYPNISKRLERSWASVRSDAGMTLLVDARRGTLSTQRRQTTAELFETDPVAMPRWLRTCGDNEWEENVGQVLEERRIDRQSVLPAATATVSGENVFWRTADGLQAVDWSTGVPIWTIPLPDGFGRTQVSTQPNRLLQMPQNTWRTRTGGAKPFEHEILAGGPRSRLTADDERLFVVIDPKIRSSRLASRQFRFSQRDSSEAETEFSTNLLRAVDQSDGRTLWELGGPSLQDTFDRPLAGTFFIGPPAISGDQIYVLGERVGEIQLLVLEAATGKIVWSQPICATQAPIDQDPTRRFWCFSPTLVDGIAVCPTGTGWIIAVDIDGRELLWAKRVVPPQERSRRYYYAQLTDVDSAWRPTSPIVDGNRIWLFPPERGEQARILEGDQAICLDIPTGKELAAIDREEFHTAVSSPGEGLLLVGLESLAYFDSPSSDNESSNVLPKQRWKRSLGAGRSISGRPAVSGSAVHVAVNGDELWTLDASTGDVLARRPFDDTTALGNLVAVESKLLSCSSSALIRLSSSDELNSVQTDSFTASLKHARVTGDIERALEILAQWASETAGEPESAEFFGLAIATLANSPHDSSIDATDIVDRLEELAVESNDRLQLERFRVLAVEHSRGPLAAFLRLVELAQRDDLEQAKIVVRESVDSVSETLRTVRFDRWLTAYSTDLWDTLSPQDRDIADRKIAEIMTSASQASLLRLAGTGSTVDVLRDQLTGIQLNGNGSLDNLNLVRRLSAVLPDEIADAELDAARDAVLSATPWRRRATPIRPWTTSLEIVKAGVGTGRVDPVPVPIISDDVDHALNNIKLEFVPAIRSILVRSEGTGELLATLPVNERARRSYDSQPHAWLDRDQLFIVLKANLYAFSVFDWAFQWSCDLPPDVAFHRLADEAAVTFRRPRGLTEQLESRFSAVAAIGSDVMVIRRRSGLAAIDRTGGSICWERDLYPEEVVLGSLDCGLVLRRGDLWRLVRFIDGMTLPITMDESPDRAIAIFGQTIVTIDPEGFSGPVDVIGWSVESESSAPVPMRQWTKSLRNDIPCALLGPRMLASIEEPDRLDVLDLESGKRSISLTVVGLPSVSEAQGSITAIIDDGTLLVTTDMSGSSERSFNLEGGASVLVDGTLAAVDLVSGELSWTPLEGVTGNLVWGHSYKSPVLIFLRRERKLVMSQPITTFDISAISRSNGKEILRSTIRLNDGHLSRVMHSPGDDVLDVRLTSTLLRVQAVANGGSVSEGAPE